MMRRLMTMAVAAALLAGCDDAAAPTGIGDGPARVRAFNAVVNRNTSVSGALDVLVSGAVQTPGVAGVAAGAASPYGDAEPGVYGFTTRMAGDARPIAQSNLFRREVRLRTAGGFGYTLVVAGVVPPTGVPAAGAVEPVIVPDDPFAPSRGADGRLQARVRLVNAAPYAAGTEAGTLISLFVTPGTQPPGSLFGLAAQSVVAYRQAGAPLELSPGTYTVTIARTANARVLGRQVVELAPGAARTFVISSIAPTTAPALANHRLSILNDGDFQ
jgi:hypothetical protein